MTARWDQSPDLAQYGVGFLLYGLLDYVADTHFDAVQALDGQIEGLEDQLFDEAPLAKLGEEFDRDLHGCNSRKFLSCLQHGTRLRSSRTRRSPLPPKV